MGIIRLISVLFGSVASANRGVSNSRNANNANALASRLQSNPQEALPLISEMRQVYVFRKTTEDFLDLKKMFSSLAPSFAHKRFAVLHHTIINPDHYFFVTKCADQDFDTTWTGAAGSVNKTYNFNFVVKRNHQMKRYEICSEFAEGNTDKYLRDEFALFLRQYLPVETKGAAKPNQ
jgi:hypothetical protein